VAASFIVELPAVFGQVSKGSAEPVHPLPAVKTYKDWNAHDGIQGTKKWVDNALEMKIRGLHSSLLGSFGENPRAFSLATACLQASGIFPSQMSYFIDAFYSELIKSSGASAEEEAWLLTVSLI